MNIKISDHFTYKKLFTFVLPPVFMMILTSIYGVIDGYFISNFVGKTQFAAINFIYPFIMILGGTGFMIGAGGTALVAKTLGEGNEKRANELFTIMIKFCILLGIILTVSGILLIRPICILLKATEEMTDYCVIYGSIVISFTTFFMLQSNFHSFFSAAEKQRMGLAVTIIAGCANAALDALFIVVFDWGLVGAALATGIGQVIGGLVPLVYFARPNASRLRFVKAKLELKPVLAACANGSSELLTNVSSSIVSMLYNMQLMRFYGEDGVSAYGVLMYVQFFFLAIEIGYSIGVSPVVSYNYGAQNTKELKKEYRFHGSRRRVARGSGGSSRSASRAYIRRLRQNAFRPHGSRFQAVFVRVRVLGHQYLFVGIFHRAQQRTRFRDTLVSARSRFSDDFRVPFACVVQSRRNMVRNDCNRSVRVYDGGVLPRLYAKKIQLLGLILYYDIRKIHQQILF